MRRKFEQDTTPEEMVEGSARSLLFVNQISRLNGLRDIRAERNEQERVCERGDICVRARTADTDRNEPQTCNDGEASGIQPFLD